MKTQNKVLTVIAEAKKAGYEQVSTSEIAHRTGLSTRAVVATLRRKGLPNFKRGNEVFFRLEQVQTVYHSELALKSAIFGDLA